jgi:phosphinothricin acetyltransferase
MAAAGGTIRDAVPVGDAAGCLAIYGPYIRDTVISFEEAVPTVEEFAERMRATSETHPWLVLDDGGEIAGYAYASRHAPRAAYRWSADVAVYVASARHRSGVGRRLYTELLDRLRRQRFRVACAGITLPNDASVGLHEALGFRPVGIYRRIGWKAGAWHDVGWWQLELAAGDDPPAEPLAPGPLPPAAR